MAEHPSTLKRQRQSEKTQQRYRQKKSEMNTEIKKFKNAPSVEASVELLKSAQSLIAKFGQNGNIHKKTASRKISKLAKALNKAKAS